MISLAPRFIPAALVIQADTGIPGVPVPLQSSAVAHEDVKEPGKKQLKGSRNHHFKRETQVDGGHWCRDCHKLFVFGGGVFRLSINEKLE